MGVLYSPGEPGAPCSGDVVVVYLGSRGLEWTGVLSGVGTEGLWRVRDTLREWKPYTIRRPTEAESIQWALDPEGAGEMREVGPDLEAELRLCTGVP